MRRLLVGLALLVALPALGQAPLVVPRPVLPAHPRVMAFAPHPDDETLALGGLLYRLTHARVPVRVVFVTNGDGFPPAAEEKFDRPRPTDEDYVALGELRQREARAAARRLGLKRHQLSFLGFPDGGLAELWRAHWSRARPYTSPYTGEDRPPYPDSVAPNVDYDGQELTSVIARLLAGWRPTVVLMPHPADAHLDHAHTSYFVTEAVRALQEKGILAPHLRLLTYLVHYAGWPARRGPLFDRFVPVAALADTAWVETELSRAELAAKRAALAEYQSQLEVMGGFLRGFLLRNELFATVGSQLLSRIASVH